MTEESCIIAPWYNNNQCAVYQYMCTSSKLYIILSISQGGCEINYFGKPFLAHYYYTLMQLECGYALAQEPAPGVTKFKILVDPSLVIVTIYSVCFIYSWQ